MLAAQEAVVGEEEDVGVVSQLLAPELVEDLADALVDRQQRLPGTAALAQDVGDLARGERRSLGDRRGLVADVCLVERCGQVALELVLERAEMTRSRDGGTVAGAPGLAAAAAVRRRVAEREEERVRRLRALADEALCLRREDVGGVVLLRLAELDQAAVLVQGVAEVLRARRGQHTPVVPASGNVDRQRSVLIGLGVLVEELADVARAVAGGLEPEREVVVAVKLVEDAVAAVGRLVGEHLVIVRVLAGEKRRSRGAAEREVVVEALHGHALALHLLVHRLHDPHRRGLLVVGEQDDDVGPALERARSLGLGVWPTDEDDGRDDREQQEPGRERARPQLVPIIDRRLSSNFPRHLRGGLIRPPGSKHADRVGVAARGVSFPASGHDSERSRRHCRFTYGEASDER